MRKKTIILLSSGIDSALNLALSQQKDHPLLALTFNYGQQAARKEIYYAEQLARYYLVPHQVIKLDWYKALGQMAMTKKHFVMPVFDHINQASQTVWMPNRNGLFVNIAACFAEALGSEVILFGGNAEEAETFPDNSPQFIRAKNKALSYSTLKQVKLKSYTIKMNKTEIAKKAWEIGLPLKHLWSCYYDRSKMCGECESCLRLKRGARESGIELKYLNF